MKIITKQKGLTLIELLISMLIGAFVLSGVFKVFDFTKRSNRTLQAEAEMQENARFAFSVITSIVQEAGNFGCQTLSTISIVKSTNDTFKPTRVIEGWEASNTHYRDIYTPNISSAVVTTNSSHWSTSDAAQIDTDTFSKEYSDILKVWYSKKERGIISAINGNLLTFSAIDLEQGDIISINDCQTAVFAQVCQCEDNDCADMDTQANIARTACDSPGNDSFNSSNLNISTTEVNILDAALFFVGKRDNNADNIPSLFVRHLGNNATLGIKEEILEGVESMQVLYGEDISNNKSPDYYVSADNVSNWNNIISIKISLLLRSSKNRLAQGTQSIRFNGANVNITGSSDKYLRHVFTSTISLRNRNIGY